MSRIENSIKNIPTELKGNLFKSGLNYSVAATLDSIRHLTDGKKAMTVDDVIDYMDRFADTIAEFDSVSYSTYVDGYGKRNHGILFKKTFEDGTLVSFNIVSNKKRSLRLQTVYMENADYKKKKFAQALLLQNAEAHTPKAGVSQTSTDSISQIDAKSQDQNSDNSVKYSKRRDAEYLALADRYDALSDADKAKVQQMVNDAAKEAGLPKGTVVYINKNNLRMEHGGFLQLETLDTSTQVVYANNTTKPAKSQAPNSDNSVKKQLRSDSHWDWEITGGTAEMQGFFAKLNVGISRDFYAVAENAKHIKSADETGKDAVAHKDVLFWDYFEKTVQIDGQMFDIVVEVRQLWKQQYLYDIFLQENKNLKVLPVLTTDSLSAGSQTGRTPYNNSIAQKAPPVNTILSENAEKDSDNSVKHSKQTDEDVQYSIRHTASGAYVHIDNENTSVDFSKKRQAISFIKKFMRNKFLGKVFPVSDQVAYIGRTGINEYLHPANRRLSDESYQAKLMAGTELDNLLLISEKIGHSEDLGHHPEAVGGWDHYRTVFEINGRFWEGTVLVMLRTNGREFKDVTHIKEISHTVDQSVETPVDMTDLKNSIAQKAPTVNTSISENAEKDSDNSVKYSIRHNVVDVNGKVYNNVVQLEYDVFNKVKHNSGAYVNFIREHLIGEKITVTNNDGSTETVEFARQNERVTKNGSKNSHPVVGKLTQEKRNPNRLIILNAKETAEISEFKRHSDENSHQWLDVNGWDERESYVLDAYSILYPVTLHIAKTLDGRNILYAISIKAKEGVAIDKGSTDLQVEDLQPVKFTKPSGNNNTTNQDESQAPNSDNYVKKQLRSDSHWDWKITGGTAEREVDRRHILSEAFLRKTCRYCHSATSERLTESAANDFL